MNKLQALKFAISKSAGRTGLLVKKFSPEILMGVGVIGVIGSTVMACKSTLKVEAVLDNHEKKVDKIKFAKDTLPEEEYSEGDYKKDMVVAYTQTTMDFIKLYGPSVVVGVASLGCIIGSHGIMRKRNFALMAAYKAIDEGFTKYRKRVVDELGIEKDYEFKHGIKKETSVETVKDENGEEVVVKKTVEVMDPNGISQYARFFDETCSQWSKTPEYNLIFLKCQQNYANDLLQSRGHLFLNEVYDMIGIPRSQAGAVVGWVIGEGDNFVSFGIYDYANAPNRRFVNGDERSILLDFNVDGVIYDLI